MCIFCGKSGLLHDFGAVAATFYAGTDGSGSNAAAAATPPPGSAAEIAYLNGLTSTNQVAATSFWTWNQNTPATYNTWSWANKWGSTTPGTTGGTVTYWFDAASAWTATEKAALESGLALWSAVANINFALASSAATANFIFYEGTDGSAYEDSNSWATSVGSSITGGFNSTGTRISIDTDVAGFGPIGASFGTYGGYPWQTLLHEIGHLIGLGHGGPYNGNVNAATQQFSAYDTRLWTIMSYINPSTTSAKYYSSYPVTGTNWGVSADGYFNVPTTMMILDILAAQQLYGAATSGPLASGGQVFGFNSNIAGSIHNFFDFTVNTKPIITIWDGGLNNTLDLSGWNTASTINLNPGTFSSANGMVNNIGIAAGTVIETAIGGGGNDTIIGSDANNVFDPKGGNNTINGGAGTDTLKYSSHAGVQVVNVFTGTATNGLGGTDSFSNVENFLMGSSNDTVFGGPGNHFYHGGGGNNTISYVNATNPVVINLAFGTVQNGFGGTDTMANFATFIGGQGNDTLIGGPGSVTLDGGGGFNIVDYTNSPNAATFDMAHGIFLNGYGGTDKLANFAVFRGTTHNDTFIGAPGSVTMDGAAGIDKLDYSQQPGFEIIDVYLGTAKNGYGGTDLISNFENFFTGNGNDTIFGGAGNHFYHGGGGLNTINYSHATNSVIINLSLGTVQNGFGGIDTMANFATFVGGAANDTLLGGPGSVTLDGGGGFNIVDYSNAPGSVTFDMMHGIFHNGFGGVDNLANFATFKGSANNDLFIAPPGSITMDGGAGIDTIDYSQQPGACNVNLSTGIVQNGFGGTDQIFNFEIVKTGAQNDTLTGGANACTLYGGGGDNTFVFHDGFGVMTIADFTLSTNNILDLSATAAFNNFADVQAHWAQTGNNVTITDPFGGSIIIQNTTLLYLQNHQSEFLF